MDLEMRFMWIFLTNVFVTVEGWSCVSPVTKAFSRVNTKAVLQFDLSAYVSDKTSDNFVVKFYDGSPQAKIIYGYGNIITDKRQGVEVTADMSGNVVVTKENIEINNAGIYYISSSTIPTRCSCLYILGTPTKASVSATSSPSVGGSVTLTCTSTSATKPSNHSLGFMYNWRVDLTDNPSDSRYSYSTNKNTLTLSNIVRDDANKQFTCTATEDVSGGYTSSRSDSMSLDVHYGPEDIDFSPNTTNYERNENTNLESVTCKAKCNPECSFRWNKVGNDTAVTNSAVLTLGSLSSSMAGRYRCKAMRTGGSAVTKDLTVNVIYGPRDMHFTPSNTANRYNVNSNPPPITCSSSCWLCEYRWTGPNSYSVSGPVLDLDSLQRSMHGQYTCTATNTKYSPLRQEQKNVAIEVRYGPDTVNVTPASLSLTVDEGSILDNIKCVADCFPDCTYRWTKGGQNDLVMRNTDVLYLGHMNKSHTGNYTCTATNGDITTWTKEIRVSIRVRYGPYSSSTELSPPAQEHIRNEGSTLPDIRCYADCFPKCTYTWTRSRQGVTTTVATIDGVLSLNLLNRQDAGNYTCTATNPGKLSSPETTKTVEVHIRYGPDTPTVSVKSPYTVNEGSVSDDVRCSADCYPGCSFSWFNETSRSEISSDNVLSLGTVNRYMAGTYRCTSSNTAPEYKHSSENKVTVIVQYTAVQSFYIKEHPGQDNVTVDEHDAQIEFKCNVYSNTASKTKITFEGNLIKERVNVTSLSVSRQDVSCYDAGVYTCEGISDTGKMSSQKITLSVRCVPRPRDQVQRNVTTKVYSTITLSFTAIAYPEPNPKGFAWHKDEDVGWVPLLSNNHLKISSSGLQSNLTVLNVSKEDYGNYRVTVTNDIGTYVQLFFLSGKMSTYHTCTNSRCNCQRSEQTTLIVAITLGVVCCVLASVAFYLNMLRMRTYAKDESSPSRPKKHSTYVNLSFASNVVERHGHENTETDLGEASNEQQYTDLSRYANTDKDTYDVIRKT